MAIIHSRRTSASEQMPRSGLTQTAVVRRGCKTGRALIALAELLDAARIPYEIEKVFLNGDRHIAVDFYVKSAMLAIEVDGSAHDTSKSYGRPRQAKIANKYRHLAEELGATGVIFSTSHSTWDEASLLDVTDSFAKYPHLIVRNMTRADLLTVPK
jgi:hypothetical protein